MDQNQGLKKSHGEQPSTSAHQPQRTYARSTPLNSTLQNQRQHQQSYQYIPLGVARPQTSQQHHHEREQQRTTYQTIQVAPQQIIKYEYYEAPMTLNAWTQTNNEDVPKQPRPTPFSALTEAALLARIQELEETIKNMSVTNQRETAPPPAMEPDTPASPRSTHENTTYRILTQSGEGSNETQIEIEVSDEPENAMDSSLPSEVYTVNPSPTPMVQEEEEPAPEPPAANSVLVSIGPNDTKIPAAEFDKISWISPSIATRKLLTTIFDRETLATHSMTGKASPAFKDLNKPVKGQLEPNAVQDIIFVVSKKCGVSPKEVRSAITTKCADENKMLKLKHSKRLGTTENRRSALSELNRTRRER